MEEKVKNSFRKRHARRINQYVTHIYFGCSTLISLVFAFCLINAINKSAGGESRAATVRRLTHTRASECEARASRAADGSIILIKR